MTHSPNRPPEVQPSTWYLPITHCRRVRYQEAALSSAKLLETYWHLWDPACSLRFVTEWSSGELSVGYEATSDSADDARVLLESLRTALRTIQPWLGAGDVTDSRPWSTPGPVHTTFGTVRPDGSLINAAHSLAWRSGAGHEGLWQLVVDLLAPEDSPDPQSSSLGAHGWGDEDLDVGFRSGYDGLVDGALARITLHGHGQDGSVLAALLSADSAADSRLVAHRPGTDAATELGTAVPGTLLAHLLATPCRVGGLLPDHTAVAADTLFERMEAAPTPHALLIGASGQGKSTALGAIGARALAAGQTVVAVDVHDGDLLRRLYEAARAAGRPALFIDCTPGASDRVPALRLADVPDGSTADQHVENLWTMLRHDVWADMPTEYFGPVGQRITRAVLALAVKDPARTFGLSQFPALIDPAADSFRTALLRRVSDDDLSRVILRDVMPMVTSKDPDNSFSWIVSKFDPLGSPVVRGILEGATDRVPVEDALERGCSLFLHAPAGLLGEDAARTIAAVFLHRVWAARRRGTTSSDVVLLLDELQKYASRLTSTMLAEARKFRVRLIAAHQNLAQLPTPIRESLLANTGSIGCYRLGPADAVMMDGLFPTVPIRTLQTLARHTVALTTFEADVVTAGPLPLPEPVDPIPSWGAQLDEFWGGPEPRPEEYVAPPEFVPVDLGEDPLELAQASLLRRLLVPDDL